jgi:pentatricopeptide repeat protein
MFDWFKKRREAPAAEAGERPVHDRPEDAATVERLQRLCWHAQLSAERVGEDKFEWRPVEEWDDYEHKRYGRLRNEGIALADTLSDEFYRSAGLELLIELFMKAGDFDDARLLFENMDVGLGSA